MNTASYSMRWMKGAPRGTTQQNHTTYNWSHASAFEPGKNKNEILKDL